MASTPGQFPARSPSKNVGTPIQITSEIAEGIANAIQRNDSEGERHRLRTVARLDQRCRTVMARLDRGYDDFVSGKISEEFWTRKSQEWEGEVQAVDGERARLLQPKPCATATAAKILALAIQAESLYKAQAPLQQRRLLETVPSNCTFDRGTLCPTYSEPFDLLVRGNETGDWRREWDSNPR